MVHLTVFHVRLLLGHCRRLKVSVNSVCPVLDAALLAGWSMLTMILAVHVVSQDFLLIRLGL